MAIWYGTARSNYVKIKDEEGLLASIEPWSLNYWRNSDGMYAFGGDDDSGCFPSYNMDDEEFDPKVNICPFMEDGQVLIFMEVGAEKMRYVTGWASAWHSNGESVYINLLDIYDKAAEAWPDATITQAEY